MASNGASREGPRVGREGEREGGKEREREGGREGERICTVPLPYGTVPVLPVLYRYGRYRVP